MMLNGWNKDDVRRWAESLKVEPVDCDELNEETVWTNSDVELWQAKRFVGRPSFYPVYQWRDYYSYSPLTLLLKKGKLDLDAVVAGKVVTSDWDYVSGKRTLDKGIKRIGGPLFPRYRIRTPEEYAQAIADALKKDISRVEAAHPDKTNVVLVGGKDSLNLLFLPWKNPVLVVSAAPSYEPVKQFIKDHKLPFKVIELTDGDRSILPQEVLVNFCRNNLEHCHWAPELAQIARDLGGRLIFWKGQLGGRLMNARWAHYTNPLNRTDYNALKRICSIWGGRGEYRIRKILKESGVTQLRTFLAYWSCGAMWQGAHMSFIRQLTGALTLSAYHGRAMRNVIEQVDLNRAVPYDIRPILGRCLYGQEVQYPEDNHGPGPSTIRSGLSHLKPFLEVLKETGVVVNDGAFDYSDKEEMALC